MGLLNNRTHQGTGNAVYRTWLFQNRCKDTTFFAHFQIFFEKNVFFVRFVPFSALEAGEKRRSRADLHPRVPRKSHQAFPMIGLLKLET